MNKRLMARLKSLPVLVMKQTRRRSGAQLVSKQMPTLFWCKIMEEEKTAAASHDTGRLKVKFDEYLDSIGAAPHSTRNCGPQETDKHDYGSKKHELQEIRV
jgi:hypothetical protein